MKTITLIFLFLLILICNLSEANQYRGYFITVEFEYKHLEYDKHTLIYIVEYNSVEKFVKQVIDNTEIDSSGIFKLSELYEFPIGCCEFKHNALVGVEHINDSLKTYYEKTSNMVYEFNTKQKKVNRTIIVRLKNKKIKFTFCHINIDLCDCKFINDNGSRVYAVKDILMYKKISWFELIAIKRKIMPLY